MKKSLILLFLAFIVLTACNAQKEIRLLVRADDLGSSHNANLACIESYKNGIVRSVELMIPGPWFPEAVKLLKENPGLDVGVHLVLTSEWENYKWRPLTGPSSLTDETGYFYPMVWPNQNYPENRSLAHSGYKMEEVEKELRAQIEMAIKLIPQVSHLSSHMAFTSLSPEMDELVNKLASEYHLETEMNGVDYAGKYYKSESGINTPEAFKGMLESLKPGTYIFVEHPGLDTPESRAIGHIGYDNVASERQGVTTMFTSDEVKKLIENKKIQLISYADLRK
jgi:chitin disaccharide deacetylase